MAAQLAHINRMWTFMGADMELLFVDFSDNLFEFTPLLRRIEDPLRTAHKMSSGAKKILTNRAVFRLLIAIHCIDASICSHDSIENFVSVPSKPRRLILSMIV